MCWIETPWLGWSVVRDNTFLEGAKRNALFGFSAAGNLASAVRTGAGGRSAIKQEGWWWER